MAQATRKNLRRRGVTRKQRRRQQGAGFKDCVKGICRALTFKKKTPSPSPSPTKSMSASAVARKAEREEKERARMAERARRAAMSPEERKAEEKRLRREQKKKNAQMLKNFAAEQGMPLLSNSDSSNSNENEESKIQRALKKLDKEIERNAKQPHMPPNWK